MSREEVSACLRNLQLSLDGLQRELEGSIRALPETKRDALPELLAGVRRRLARFMAEQLRELDEFAEEAGLTVEEQPTSAAAGDAFDAASPAGAGAAGSGGEGTPFAVQLRSLEQRVAGMGGIPALGACVLPKMTPGMRPQLAATASPAAVEIMQRRLGGEENATPLRKTGSGENEAAPTPLVQLRHTPAPAGKQGASPLGAAPPNSELAAAIQRRMQRLGSASPEKDAAAAAAAAVEAS
ncbi:hypothetical protein COHA_004089 [Chlorella ohadii]|uniref:Uncharacterized protein n=1 Tax=Chlorella ohadii TaxID=2649997 RepID=A0AAD5H6W7_9CHLO|nr:hypothetical protein COHA_004089 [Chlorella ohadii]